MSHHPGTATIRPCLLAAAVLLHGGVAAAQAPDSAPPQTRPSPPAWSFRAPAPTYIFPDDDDYVQPTLTADRGPLHLEGRYNYEDLRSVSAFAGWNLSWGDSVSLELTPMFGGV